MIDAIEASGAEIVTVAVRRVDLNRENDEGILHHLDPERFFLLANTAGCYSADEAIRYARLARAAGFNEWVKLEVIGDQETLLPDTDGLLEATRTLAAEGFKCMAYTNDDLITALKLEDAGVGTASDACIVMEQGVDGILMNTGIAGATDPVRMATAMRQAVEAGRLAFLAGRMPRREIAVPSSPVTGMIDT
jgi:thiazole synthase